MKVALISSLFLFLSSCSLFENKKVCQVGDSVLYEEDLEIRKNLLPPDLDDDAATKKAIEQWADEQRIKLEIEKKAPHSKLKHEIQVEDELMKLNLFELENIYIEQNMDSTVTEQEIQDYYNSHRENYKTQSYIVRALYIKISDTMAKVLNMDEHYLLKTEKDREEIKKFANLYATNFYFEEKRWIFFEDLIRGIPISSDKRNELIQNRGAAKFSDNGETHYINILDYKIKSISSPLEVERDKIRIHILTKKANKIRQSAKKIILKNVQEKYPITYF